MPMRIVTLEAARKARDLRRQYRTMVKDLDREIKGRKKVMGLAMRTNHGVHQDPRVIEAAAMEIAGLMLQKNAVAAQLLELG